MKYFLELLKELEQGNIAPLYLFYGPEVYLQEKAVERFRQHLLPEEVLAFNYDPCDGEETPEEEIVRRAQVPPFLASRRLVVVRHAPFFGGSQRKASRSSPLAAYFAHPSPTACLIFTTSHPVDLKSQLAQALLKRGRAVEFTYLNKPDLVRWLQKQARLAGKAFSPEAAALLVERAGPDLLRLSQEFHKLLSYVGAEKEIKEEHVSALTVPLPEESIFRVMDALGEKRYREALAGIRDLLRAGHQAPAVLAMVARQFRLLLLARELKEKKEPPARIAAQLGVPPFVARKLLAQAENFSRQQAVMALSMLLNADEAVKKGRMDFLAAMEMLILRLALG